MPTVYREAGFVFKVYGPPREHLPPHIHVEKGQDVLLVIRLGLRGGRPKVWEVHGRISRRSVLRVVRIVEEREGLLRTAWEEIHGHTKTKRS